MESGRPAVWPAGEDAVLLVRLVVVLAVLIGASPARAGGVELATFGQAETSRKGAFTICHDQTYALCAVASCFVFNEVAYCTCEVKHGDSISLSFAYGRGKDVCSVNAAGKGNGYMVSTYSLPRQVVKPKGDLALYTCPGATSSGAYAQCDGGICFRSTQGQNFPGAKKPLAKNEIICSCPITQAEPPAQVGYQIVGPYPCRRSFFANCSAEVASGATGSRLHVGAPTGSAVLLTRLLEGQVPPLNRCRSPEAATLP